MYQVLYNPQGNCDKKGNPEYRSFMSEHAKQVSERILNFTYLHDTWCGIHVLGMLKFTGIYQLISFSISLSLCRHTVSGLYIPFNLSINVLICLCFLLSYHSSSHHPSTLKIHYTLAIHKWMSGLFVFFATLWSTPLRKRRTTSLLLWLSFTDPRYRI